MVYVLFKDRIEKVLLYIIHLYQNAFVKGRTIFDAVRMIDNVMVFMELMGCGGMSAFNFEKAFDSLSFQFKSLESICGLCLIQGKNRKKFHAVVHFWT